MGIPHTLIKIGGIALILALSIAAGPRAAAEDPPGNNGTVKVHDGDSEAEPIKRNEPHVGCTFHIHGFNFDASSSGTWNIQSWPPTGDRSVIASGSWGPADGEGDWRTAVMSLPGGDHEQGAHYKLNVDQTTPPTPGGEKHKVFWVECAPIAPIGSVGTPPTVVTGTPTILLVATAIPTIEAIVLVGGSVIPPNSVIILPSAIVLPNGVNLAAGEIQPGTLLPAGTALPAGTTFRVLGVETAPVSVPAVRGIQALPSTSTD